MMSREGKEDIMGLKESLRGVLSGRACQNWAIALFYVKQVSFPTGIIYNTYIHFNIDSYFSGLDQESLFPWRR